MAINKSHEIIKDFNALIKESETITKLALKSMKAFIIEEFGEDFLKENNSFLLKLTEIMCSNYQVLVSRINAQDLRDALSRSFKKEKENLLKSILENTGQP